MCGGVVVVCGLCGAVVGLWVRVRVGWGLKRLEGMYILVNIPYIFTILYDIEPSIIKYKSQPSYAQHFRILI